MASCHAEEKTTIKDGWLAVIKKNELRGWSCKERYCVFLRIQTFSTTTFRLDCYKDKASYITGKKMKDYIDVSNVLYIGIEDKIIRGKDHLIILVLPVSKVYLAASNCEDRLYWCIPLRAYKFHDRSMMGSKNTRRRSSDNSCSSSMLSLLRIRSTVSVMSTPSASSEGSDEGISDDGGFGPDEFEWCYDQSTEKIRKLLYCKECWEKVSKENSDYYRDYRLAEPTETPEVATRCDEMRRSLSSRHIAQFSSQSSDDGEGHPYIDTTGCCSSTVSHGSLSSLRFSQETSLKSDVKATGLELPISRNPSRRASCELITSNQRLTPPIQDIRPGEFNRFSRRASCEQITTNQSLTLPIQDTHPGGFNKFSRRASCEQITTNQRFVCPIQDTHPGELNKSSGSMLTESSFISSQTQFCLDDYVDIPHVYCNGDNAHTSNRSMNAEQVKRSISRNDSISSEPLHHTIETESRTTSKRCSESRIQNSSRQGTEHEGDSILVNDIFKDKSISKGGHDIENEAGSANSNPKASKAKVNEIDKMRSQDSDKHTKDVTSDSQAGQTSSTTSSDQYMSRERTTKVAEKGSQCNLLQAPK